MWRWHWARRCTKARAYLAERRRGIGKAKLIAADNNVDGPLLACLLDFFLCWRAAPPDQNQNRLSPAHAPCVPPAATRETYTLTHHGSASVRDPPPPAGAIFDSRWVDPSINRSMDSLGRNERTDGSSDAFVCMRGLALVDRRASMPVVELGREGPAHSKSGPKNCGLPLLGRRRRPNVAHISIEPVGSPGAGELFDTALSATMWDPPRPNAPSNARRSNGPCSSPKAPSAQSVSIPIPSAIEIDRSIDPPMHPLASISTPSDPGPHPQAAQVGTRVDLRSPSGIGP